MKLKKVVKEVLTSKAIWPKISPIVNMLTKLTRIERDKRLAQVVNFQSIICQSEVMNGPFKGTKYPFQKAAGSSFIPKILGSYECELWSIFNKISLNDYSIIVDIGCAEGYYAVGLARVFRNAKVFAYDIEEEARNLCKELAKENEVSERIELRELCSSEELKYFPFESNSLVISDCEGFESSLFNDSNIENLRQCDVLIECHDFLDINISSKMKKLFSQSHNVISVFSVDDIQKAHQYEFDQLRNFSLEERRIVLSEYRPSIMEWVFCQSKTRL